MAIRAPDGLNKVFSYFVENSNLFFFSHQEANRQERAYPTSKQIAPSARCYSYGSGETYILFFWRILIRYIGYYGAGSLIAFIRRYCLFDEAHSLCSSKPCSSVLQHGMLSARPKILCDTF